MNLEGIDFGHVINASGTRGFFGEGYWFHKFFRLIGLRFDNSTFVPKTTTLYPRKGNMRTTADKLKPLELFPSCIKAYPLKGVVLNSVGLTGPGAHVLLNQGIWQQIQKSFFISFMSVVESSAHRLAELADFVQLLESNLSDFRSPFGLKLNFSCPNAGLDPRELIGEVQEALQIASCLGVPLVPKFNVTVPPKAVVDIANNKYCSALCVSNTIPWGQLPDKIDWQKLFGVEVSPLDHLGGGGLSGPPLLNLVVNWIREARSLGIEKPMIGGGGVFFCSDADKLQEAGASAISLGTVAMLRPWRVAGIIKHINQLYA